MKLSQKVTDTITGALAKALASSGPEGVNVVPVSMVKVNTDTIWLFDFFMDKTAKNIQIDSPVALVAWSEMIGVQIKAEATYVTEGNDFAEAIAWVKTQNPTRIVKGLIVLKPTNIFDISPGGAFSDEELALV